MKSEDFNYASAIQLIECPRDAMQGWKNYITTDKKIKYINSLLQIGFDTIDAGSFVSPKAVPQMSDTSEVLKGLRIDKSTDSRLLVIVANLRGAEEAIQFDPITYLGYPFSISETFQLRNTNSTIEKSIDTVEGIQNLCLKHNKKLVIYLSMGFGNPYGDEYNEQILITWADEMVKRDIKIISLSDTVGVATPEQISFALTTLIPKYTDTVFGVHLHSTIYNWKPKVEAAYNAGCRRFDGALKGIGGCPMADDVLVGNMATEWLISYFQEQNALPRINKEAFKYSMELANEVFL